MEITRELLERIQQIAPKDRGVCWSLYHKNIGSPMPTDCPICGHSRGYRNKSTEAYCTNCIMCIAHSYLCDETYAHSNKRGFRKA